MLTKKRWKLTVCLVPVALLFFSSCSSQEAMPEMQRAASEGFPGSVSVDDGSLDSSDDDLGPAEVIDPERVTSAPNIDTETEAGPGDNLPELVDVLDEIDMDGPCALFTDADLADLVGTSAESAGLMDELPAGIGDSPIEFVGVTSTPTACEWFSDAYFWYVGISWEPADPSFVDAIFEESDEFGSGYRAALVDDTTAQLAHAELLITISNLPPSHESISSDAVVTRDLLVAIADRIS